MSEIFVVRVRVYHNGLTLALLTMAMLSCTMDAGAVESGLPSVVRREITDTVL